MTVDAPITETPLKGSGDETTAIGRRKTAVARVRMKLGSGQFSINGSVLDTYFPRLVLRKLVMQPLVLTDSEKRFDFMVTLHGGGLAGQAGALRHGISRALTKFDDKVRPALKAAHLLTRDPRMKERKKYGRRGARRKFQFSKR